MQKNTHNHTTWNEVSLALIQTQGKILLGLRKNSYLWEFPGGKIKISPDNPHKAEHPEHALKREVKEELGIQATRIQMKGILSAQISKDKIFMFYLFGVNEWIGEPSCKVHLELKWIYPKALYKLPSHPVNKTILPQIISLLDNR